MKDDNLNKSKKNSSYSVKLVAGVIKPRLFDGKHIKTNHEFQDPIIKYWLIKLKKNLKGLKINQVNL